MTSEKSMGVTKKDLLRFAEEVREKARHVVSELHPQVDPAEAIEKINLDALVDQFWSEDEETSEGVDLIAQERRRQIREEEYTPEHDDQWEFGELALAAACYAAPKPLYVRKDFAAGVYFLDPFPWEARQDSRPHNGNVLKTSTKQESFRLLIKAGALLAAEIDRLLRTKGGSKLKP